MDGRPLTDREADAWRALQVMQARLETALSHQLTSDAGLSHPDFLVLEAIAAAPDRRLRLFQLADRLGWEQSRVSHQVSRMVSRGFVRKVSCASDRRGAFVALTARGRRKLDQATVGHVEAIRRLVVDRLSAEQLDALGQVAERVLDAIDEPSRAVTP